MSRFVFSLAVAALAVGYGGGADLKSGPEPGKSVPAFHPLNVTGADAGEKRCLV